jgi:hypothetical protein
LLKATVPLLLLLLVLILLSHTTAHTTTSHPGHPSAHHHFRELGRDDTVRNHLLHFLRIRHGHPGRHSWHTRWHSRRSAGSAGSACEHGFHLGVLGFQVLDCVAHCLLAQGVLRPRVFVESIVEEISLISAR